jgi:hypothetical protein
MFTCRRLIVVATAVLGIANGAREPAHAHHAAPKQFDGNKPVVLRGTLTRMSWGNPHGWIYLDVRGPDGMPMSWMIETGSPNVLYRQGWRRSDLAPGTELVILGFPARDGSLTLHATRVTFGDGRVLLSESANTAGTDGLRNPRR